MSLTILAGPLGSVAASSRLRQTTPVILGVWLALVSAPAGESHLS